MICLHISLFVRREDFAARPQTFKLKISPQPGEIAVLKEGDGEVQVTVIEERDSSFIVRAVAEHQREVAKSSVIKLGGVIPVNVVTFQDGAEVFLGNLYSLYFCPFL